MRFSHPDQNYCEINSALFSLQDISFAGMLQIFRLEEIFTLWPIYGYSCWCCLLVLFRKPIDFHILGYSLAFPGPTCCIPCGFSSSLHLVPLMPLLAWLALNFGFSTQVSWVIQYSVLFFLSPVSVLYPLKPLRPLPWSSIWASVLFYHHHSSFLSYIIIIVS